MKSMSDYNLTVKKGCVLGLGAKKPYSKKELMLHLMDFEEAKDVELIAVTLIDEAKELEVLSNQPKKEQTFDRALFEERSREILLNSIYKQKLKTLLVNNNILGYIVADSGWKNLGLMDDVVLHEKELQLMFARKYEQELRELKTEIQELSIELGGPAVYNHSQITKMYLEEVMPTSEKWLEKEFIKPPSPLLFKGDSRPALQYFPFDKTTKPYLNPHIKDFLDRMHNHRYFCAYLFCSLLGYELQQVPYLYGIGNDGKSTFFRMLQDKFQSFAIYTAGNQFCFSAMVDKAFIFLQENTSLHLMKDPVIKKITGRDGVSIEFKGKNAYPDILRGLFIVDSNKAPYTFGKAETRRLRPFELQTLTIKEGMALSDAAKAYGENFEGFLAYCQECYNELKNSEGLVNDPPDHDELMANLRDPEQDDIQSKILEKLKKVDIIVNKEARISIELLYSNLGVIRERDKLGDKAYVVRNFIEYLDNVIKCKKDKNFYYGIGWLPESEKTNESSGHTKIGRRP